ncbi:MAG: hypothetical protein AUK48_08630 [Oscillatoriales cyanobacterium CG2_30_44_21]|nr:MAG: hypothetical protein AUK48_08630 [Oscillatoriales cyanobacterium CG2_30_44_21]
MLLQTLAKSFKCKGWKTHSVVTIIAIATSLAACSITNQTNQPLSSTTQISTTAPVVTPENLPLVVATNSIACGLAKQIAVDTINLKCLIAAGTAPHVYQPNPDDRQAIDSAQLILYGGYDFEPSLIK